VSCSSAVLFFPLNDLLVIGVLLFTYRNMTEYKRVVYLDIDNVAMHNIDQAFLCGHFCVVYMNPVLFHTGLMVVKPDHKAVSVCLLGVMVDCSYKLHVSVCLLVGLVWV
jgi:hypothetical protein